ncbi:3'-5' exonuclease [Oerskovia rustica]|uniref:DNA 3'-5' helicase n=1 Tax=Oerskovia rustica TaxID=2762237 RepID=A0ABR8RPZ5_9CELL|nr:3'-5' exonuclease [Oerskovia rustica]MBD7949737.1 AAA family ATPase [Oerskovia rustica]
MPQVIIPADIPSLDGSVRSQAYAFIDKLRKDDTTPGLHIEPMEQSADKRARTGRVNLFWRAVLIKLTGSDDEARYIYLGTFPHDEAIAYARSVVFQRNPHTSVPEVIRVHPAGVAATAQPPAAESTDRVLDAPGVPVLQALGITFEDLLDLGVASLTAHEAILAADQDRLLEVALAAPSAVQTDALLLLGDGTSVEQVRAEFHVDTAAVDTEHDTDDDLIGALDHPASRMLFAYLEDDDDLRAAIEDEDFAHWRVFLHPEQLEQATATTRGAFRLSGGAGTGKTVVLLHRARHLHAQDPTARVVLTTYNKTLATSLRAHLLLLDKTVRIAKQFGEPGVYIGTVDAISWRLVSRAAEYGLDVQHAATELLGRPRTQVVRATTHGAWDAALWGAGGVLAPSVRTADFLAAETGTVVVPGRITTRDQYLQVRRQGRGVALSRAQRLAVWDVIEAYRAAAASAGTTDYDEKALIAAAALDVSAAATGRRVADHVLVDEAQDLTPARLVLLRALVATGPDDLFLAEDSQQRIYAPRTVLSRHGIHVVGRSRRLRLNYRTTAQNLDYATSILASHETLDMEDGVVDGTGSRSARSGPHPVVEGYDTPDEAHETTVRTVRAWLADGTAPETVAVLVRTGNDGTTLSRSLTQHGVPNRYCGANDTPVTGRVAVMTMHRSKGMEFRNVLVFGATTESLKAVDRSPEGDRPGVLQRERSLLYVATTRARDRVAVVWDRAANGLLPDPRSSNTHARDPQEDPVTSEGAVRAAGHVTRIDEREALAREALAREVHDTVGHSLAQIAMQAAVLETVAAGDPRVREASAFIRAAAARAGTELRSVLTSLRTGADGLTTASFDDLADLLSDLKNQGARIVSSVVIADGATAPSAVTRACYRIVQESVTNALKHASQMPIDITLRGVPETGITLVIQNPMPDGEPGASIAPRPHSGIAGMADRAALVGGTLSAGAVAGRFVVDARLPWTSVSELAH